MSCENVEVITKKDIAVILSSKDKKSGIMEVIIMEPL
jgi:hypothetical protein